MRLILDTVTFVAVLSLPGFGIVASLRVLPRTVSRVLILSVATSLVYTTLASILLLHLGVFSPGAVLAVAVLPLIPTAARWRQVSRGLAAVQVRWPELLPVLAVGAAVLALLLLTPRWNFLIAPNMDAGNYELYGNHFWKSGTYTRDIGALLQAGADPSWLRGINTWAIDQGAGIARPLYFPMYPVLLGLAKATFGSAVASPIVNAGVAALCAMIMTLVGFRLMKSGVGAAALALAAALTPLFFLYGKNLMAEQLGLLAVLLIVLAMVDAIRRDAETDEPPHTVALGLAVGVSIGLLSKIDFLPVLPFLVAGLIVSEVDAWSRGDPPRAKWLPFPVAAAAFSSIAVVAAVSPSYLGQARPGSLSGILSPSQFALIYAAIASVALVAVAMSRPTLDKLQIRWGRSRLTEMVRRILLVLPIGWTVFVLWNLTLRQVTGPSPRPHDAENLLRLFSVSSLLMLIVALAASGWALASRSRIRGVLVLITGGLAIMLFASHHTEPDFWWMRRYLSFAIPLIVVSVAWAIGRLMSHRSNGRSLTRALAVSVIAAVLAYNAWSLGPLLTASINRDMPRSLATVLRDVPDDATIIASRDHRLLRGTANIVASLTSHRVLLDVHEFDLATALKIAKDAHPDQPLVIMTRGAIPPALLAEYGLGPPVEHAVTLGWVDWVADLRQDPHPSRTLPFLVYVSRS